jgi:hypothetical protein
VTRLSLLVAVTIAATAPPPPAASLTLLAGLAAMGLILTWSGRAA